MSFKGFWRSEDGYALVLTLVFLPAFLGLSLLMIDIGRGNNAHSDLQAAVDAVALAGARELDGEAGAIARAQAAMARPENTVGLLDAPGGAGNRTLIYQGPGDTRYRVDFLRTIPPSDDTPIDAAWIAANTATTDAQAAYVHVTAVLNEFQGLFPRVAGLGPGPVPIGARATATWREATCRPPPLFMCNPVPAGATGYATVQEAFNAGWFHARLLRLRESGSSGNFGFLNLGDLLGIGNLTNPVFRDNFMTARNTLNACADVTNVRLETRTGNISSLNRYLNTRFGLYDNPVRGDGFPSDTFVRKGFNMTNGCSGSVDGAFRSMLETNAYLPSAFNTTTWRFNGTNIGAMGYPANYTMSPIGTTFIGGQTAPAGTSYVWPYDYYLRFNYPTRAAAILGDPAELPPQSYPAADAVRNPNVLTPSRHDVYLYELANRATLGNAVRGNDSPNPSCSGEPVEAGARYMYLALADCAATPPTGTSVALEVIAYAKIFLTNPVISSSANEIYGEVIDLSNRGVGLTDVEYRDEAFLVR